MKRSSHFALSFACVLGFVLSFTASASAQQVAPICTENTRACMIATAQTYFDALAIHDASRVPFAPNARRTELGHDTGSGEETMRSVVDKEPDLSLKGTRWYVDEAQHMAIGFTLLLLPGTNADPERPSHQTSGQPTTVHLAERFKVVDGLIHEVEAIFYIQIGEGDGTSGWGE